MVPVILVGVTIATTGTGYTYGNARGRSCGVESGKSGLLIWGWVVALSVSGLSISVFTLVHLALERARKTAPTHSQQNLTVNEGSTAATKQEVGVIWTQEIRDVVLGILLPIEFFIIATIMWAVDQRSIHVKGDPQLGVFVECISRNPERIALCRGIGREILPSQSMVLGVGTIAAVCLFCLVPSPLALGLWH